MESEARKRDRAIRAREKKQRERSDILSLLGDICSCGFSDFRALHIDHVNGGGRLDREKHGRHYYTSVIKSIKAGSLDYQLLCANCNAIKLYENERPKKKYEGESNPVRELRPCGTHASYHRGCRCEVCIVAHRDYCRPRMRRSA